MTKTSTYFALLAEFGSAEIPLELLCQKYFGLDVATAKKAAARQRLPIPAHKAGSQKSGWLINAADLAEHIDQQREAAKKEWDNAQAA